MKNLITNQKSGNRKMSVLFMLVLMLASITGICQTAYIPNEGEGTVSVINVATNTVTATITVGNYPYGVSVSPDGTRVYVTNAMDGTVSVINTATNGVLATIPVGYWPDYLAVSPDGSTVYASNLSSNDVSVIRTSDNTVTATIG